MDTEVTVRAVQQMVFDTIRELNGVDYQTLIERDLADAIRAHDEAERFVRKHYCVTPETRAAWAIYRNDRSSSVAKQRRRDSSGRQSPRIEAPDSGLSIPKTLDGRGARRRRARRLNVG